MNDRSKAIALKIAERRLIKLGWKFNADDISSYAADILNGLEKKLDSNHKESQSD